MYCFLNDLVKSSMLLDRRRRSSVCHTFIVDILEHQGCCESLSAADAVLQRCRFASTVQTGMAVPCHADTCRPWCRVWTWGSQGRRENEGGYNECLSAHGRTCECQIQLAPPHSLRAVACLAASIQHTNVTDRRTDNIREQYYAWTDEYYTLTYANMYQDKGMMCTTS